MVTHDGGNNWAYQDSGNIFKGATSFPDGIHFWNANEGVCFGDPVNNHCEVYTTANGGITWDSVPVANIPIAVAGDGGTANMYSVVGDTIWFVTVKGNVYRSIDKGHNWNSFNIGVTNTLSRRIKFVNSNYGIISSTLSGLANNTRYTTDGGVTWNPLNYTGKFFGFDFDAVPGTAGTFVSAGEYPTEFGISYSNDGGFNWTVIDTACSYYGVDFIDTQTGWASSSIAPPTIRKYIGGIPLSAPLMVEQNELQIYPNPSDGIFTLNSDIKDGEVFIFNVVGEKVFQKK